ncbi:hypothetical protein BDQ17DRAFT_1334334 [Cyathus striatus]|nr:hypothetical protein BDQ17DRAFT_1334334 [Cyathus striatus]
MSCTSQKAGFEVLELPTRKRNIRNQIEGTSTELVTQSTSTIGREPEIQRSIAEAENREREEKINPLPVFGPPERPQTPPPAPPSDSDSEDEMAKGIPPPTSCDSPQWNGDDRHLKDWLRQLEMLYEHYGDRRKKQVRHAVGCIEKYELAKIVEKFAESKADSWEKFRQRILTEYDLDEGEEYRSASKLERMARKQRLIGDGDFCEWKEFKRMFVDEAEKGAEPEKNSLFTNCFLVNTLSSVFTEDFREKLNTHLQFMDSKVGVDETSPKKRLKEDPNTLKEVVAAVDKLMDTAPIGRVANLYTEIGGKSGSIIKKEVIESALAGSSKDSYDKVQKEIESLQKEMRTLLQSQTVLVQAQSNQYWPPVNNWGPP